MTKVTIALRLVLSLSLLLLSTLITVRGQQPAELPPGAVDVRIYLVASEATAGTSIPAELKDISEAIRKTYGRTERVGIAADFIARAAAGSIVEGRGFIEMNESAPVASLDWRIGKVDAEGVGSASIRYILQASRFSLRMPMSLAKPGAEGDAPYAYDVASFASSRSELRAGVPAVLGSFTLARPKREYFIVAVVSPVD